MDIPHRIASCENLTPAEHALVRTVMSLQDRIDGYTIEDLAEAAHTSPASISRFCKKLGLSGFREFKVEFARSAEKRRGSETVNIDYPFSEGDTPREIAHGLKALYELTLADAIGCMDFATVLKAARMVQSAKQVDIYTNSHNAMVAESFQDRLQRIGKSVMVTRSEEQQRIAAAASRSDSAAIVISYSGRATFLKNVLRILHIRHVPIILVGTDEARRVHPDVDLHLRISDQEHPQLRISQFASHIALQYALDVLFGCIFTLDYRQNVRYIAETTPLIDDRTFS